MKPLVFNYKKYVQAMERIQELEAKVQHQKDTVMKLKEENTNLRIKVRILAEDLEAERGEK